METLRLANLTIELVDDPARTLSEERKKKIVDECIPVARDAFRNEGVTEADIIKHALEVPTGIYVSDQAEKIIAFTSSVVEELAGRKILYLEGTAVQQRNSGLYGLLTGLRILLGVEQDPAADWMLSTRTQSPIVFRNIALKYRLYPVVNSEPPSEIAKFATSFAAVVRDKYSEFAASEFRFDEGTLVQHRAYGRRDETTGQESGFCMYGDIDGEDFPWCDVENCSEEYRPVHAAINAFFRDDSRINVRDGDAVLIMGRLDNQVKQLAKHEVEKSFQKVSPSDVEIREFLAARFSRLIS